MFGRSRFFSLWFLKQNQDRKHRTYVYVLTVTETLEAWEDSVNIGTASPHTCCCLYALCCPSLGKVLCIFINEAASALLGDSMRWQQVPINLGHWSWLQWFFAAVSSKSAVSRLDVSLQSCVMCWVQSILCVSWGCCGPSEWVYCTYFSRYTFGSVHTNTLTCVALFRPSCCFR